MSQLATPAVALAVGAHPDDIEFGAGATLAKWAAAGCRLHHVICTDGSKGSWDPAQDPIELVALRQREQRQASIALGGTGEVSFLGWTDGELESGLTQRRQIASLIRSTRPDVVLGHDPWKRYRLHPDHRNAGFMLVEGLVAARDPHFFPELSDPPHRPKAMLLFEADDADYKEDVTGFESAKIAALLAHRSQLRSTMGIEQADDPDAVAGFAATVLAEMARGAAAPGLGGDPGLGGEQRYAEKFKLMTEL